MSESRGYAHCFGRSISTGISTGSMNGMSIAEPWPSQRRQRSWSYSAFVAALAVIGISFAVHTVYISESHKQIQTETALMTEAVLNKGRMLEALASVTGFGHFIHGFKNYIIRRDVRYFDAAAADFERYVSHHNAYESLDLSSDEADALATIYETISAYRRNLDTAKDMITNGASIEDIDNAVQVDDSAMIDALATLQRAWYRHASDHDQHVRELIAGVERLAFGVRLSVVVAVLIGCVSLWRIVALDRREAGLQADLAQSELKLRKIFENSADGIITIDDTGVIETFNEKSEEMFGFSRKEAIGQNVAILMPKDERAQHDRYVANFNGHGSRVINRPRGLLAVKKNGEEFPIELNIAPYTVGKKRKFIGIIRDISERKLIEAALAKVALDAQASSESKSRFLANASHELRTPLNAIIGFTDMMRSEVLGPVGQPIYREYLHDIHVAGSHLRAIIEGILDLARIEAGKTDLSFETAPLDEVIGEATRFLALDVQKKSMSIETSGLHPPVHIRCDRLRVRQILINILQNAIRHSPDNTAVRIDCRTQDDTHVAIAIRDVGEGIHPDMMKRIFEPFVRHAEDLATPSGGAGLGLAISKHLAELHGGSLSIRSEHGAGTSVTIALPLSHTEI